MTIGRTRKAGETRRNPNTQAGKLAQSNKELVNVGEWVLPAHQTRSRDQLQRLFAAGEKVFARRGFSDTHVSDIVKEAGCSVGSFYRRFKDKEALFLALQADMYDHSVGNIDKFYSNPLCEEGPITAILFRFIENTGTEMLKIRGYYRALFEISLRGKDVWEQMRKLEWHMAICFKELLERRGQTGLPSDFLPVVAFAFRVINGGLISLMLHGPGPYDMHEPKVTEEFTRFVMRTAGLEADERILGRLVAARGKPAKRRARRTNT